jgi:long-subunit fatty acid transport protein
MAKSKRLSFRSRAHTAAATLALLLLAPVTSECGGLWAQNYTDVLRYSRVDPLGSSRSIGLGGAMTALGADLGTMWSNPAGLGMYRQSDFSLSLSLGAGGAKTQALDESSIDAAPHVILPQFGLALTYPLTLANFEHATLAVGYTKLNDFHERAFWTADAEGGSMTEEFAGGAQGTGWQSLFNLDAYYIEPAWNAYLIDLVDPEVDGVYAPAYTDGPVTHALRRESKGQMGETTIALGTTYRKRLHMGLSIGFTSVDLVREELYKENGFAETSDLQEWTIKDELEVSGAGMHWGAGFIYQFQGLRIGASYRSGERLKIDDYYQVTVHSMLTSVPSGYNSESPLSYIQYKVRTPRRYSLGAAWTLGKVAVVSVDWQGVNFARASFSTNDFAQNYVDGINNEVQEMLQHANILRAGLEIRATEFWRVRAGGGYESAPSINATDEGERAWASLGCGYRKDNWYMSGNYRHRMSSEEGRMFASAPYATSAQLGLGLLTVTGGVRF